MDPSKIDWWDLTTGIVSGAVTAMTGFWLHFNGRIAKLETAQNQCLIHQGIQEEQHKENLRRLERIEDGITRLLERE
jgi:hypothetical protein